MVPVSRRSKKKGKGGVLITAAVIAAFSGFALFNFARATGEEQKQVVQEERIPVFTAAAQMKIFQERLELTGNVKPRREVAVIPKIPGRIIREIHVDVGDRVTKGDLLAYLEDDTILAKIEEARAGLGSAGALVLQARARRDVLEKDKERLEYLLTEKAVARQQVDHIVAEFRAAVEAENFAKEKVREVEAKLSQLKIVMKDHKITAPVSGYISARFQDPGSLSGPRPLVAITSGEEVKIAAAVTEKDFPRIVKGMAAEISVDAWPHEVFHGEVSLVSPLINPGTRSGDMEIHLNNPHGKLKPGMFAKITISLGTRNALAAIDDAIVRLPGTGAGYLFVVEKDRAVQKNIKEGIRQGIYTEILSGLTPGEDVIVRGQNRVVDGSLVEKSCELPSPENSTES